VLPCDTPFINADVVDLLFEFSKGFDAVVPIWPSGRIEPLCSIYKRDSVLPTSRLLVSLNRERPDDLIRSGLHVFFTSITNRIKRIDPELRSFININTGDDIKYIKLRIDTSANHLKSFNLRVPYLNKSHRTLINNAILCYIAKDFVRSATLFSSAAKALSRESIHFWSALASEFEFNSILNQKLSNRGFMGGLSIKHLAEPMMKAISSYQKEARFLSKVRHLVFHSEFDERRCVKNIKSLKEGSLSTD
jgi:hypothetical protein